MEDAEDLVWGGQRLGSMSTTRLEKLAEECEDDDIRAAAEELLTYRSDHYQDRDG